MGRHSGAVCKACQRRILVRDGRLIEHWHQFATLGKSLLCVGSHSEAPDDWSRHGPLNRGASTGRRIRPDPAPAVGPMHRAALTASTHDFTSRALIRARGVGTHADASGPAYEPALASGAFGARWMRMFERAPESPTGAGRVGLSVQESTGPPGLGSFGLWYYALQDRQDVARYRSAVPGEPRRKPPRGPTAADPMSTRFR